VKVAEVEAFLMSCPLPEPLRLPFWGGERTILKRDAMLIRVTMDNGVRGYAPGPAHEGAARRIRETVRPSLVGKDPAAVLVDGRDTCAVQIALDDAVARDRGCPLSEVRHPRVRDRIKLYGSAGMYMSPDRYAEEAAAVKAMGFPAYKMRPALGPDGDFETVRKMRRATGNDFGLMVDAHSWWRMGRRSYSFDTVLHLARSIGPFGITWLEEPFPPEDHDAYRRFQRMEIMNLATGEHEQDEAGFIDLVRTRAAEFIQMDVCCQGGFEQGARLFERIKEAQLRFAFHSWGTALEVLAAAHLGIGWPERVVQWLEYPCYANGGRPGMYPFPLADEILQEPLDIRDGYLHVPNGPGLGIDVNERVIEKYPWIPGPWSFFRIDSPAETIAVTGDHSVKWVEGRGA
jgi:L-alanine-DL-glutamate epimerase-like enolase superfamily enzyme